MYELKSKIIIIIISIIIIIIIIIFLVKQWEVDMFRGMSCLDYNVWKGAYIGGMTTTTTTTTIIT